MSAAVRAPVIRGGWYGKPQRACAPHAPRVLNPAQRIRDNVMINLRSRRMLLSHASRSPDKSKPVKKKRAAHQDAVLLWGFTQPEKSMIAQMLQRLGVRATIGTIDLDRSLLNMEYVNLKAVSNPPPMNGTEDEERNDQAARCSAAGVSQRVALFRGSTGPHLDDIASWCQQIDLPPAIFWPFDTSMTNMGGRDLLSHAVRSHRSYHNVLLPWSTKDDTVMPLYPRVSMSAQVCRGQVPSSQGGMRWDESHVVVMDGLVSNDERQELLDHLTQPGWDHTKGPPTTKWEKRCVDRAGTQATWGLKQETIKDLVEHPIPAVVAVQSRLQSLYPEYVIAHMPAESMEDPDDEGKSSLTAFVANAVLRGDPCAYHIDMDPDMVPPGAPWLEQYGWYTNREAGKPLFVSILIYLDEVWPDALHAETLVLDEVAQVGISVRPKGGRLLLMDQDCPHRISQPSDLADKPRYSMVWKTVFFPRSTVDFTKDDVKLLPGLCRPEWGRPTQIGTTSDVFAVPVKAA